MDKKERTVITSRGLLSRYRGGRTVFCPRCKRSHKKYWLRFTREHGEHLACKKCAKAVGRKTTGRIYTTREYLSRCKRRAKDKGFVFDITEDDIEALLSMQGNKCALSGIPFDSEKWSIDRIDSSIGYLKDNIQLVTIRVNWMKSNQSQMDFINLCGRVWRNRE